MSQARRKSAASKAGNEKARNVKAPGRVAAADFKAHCLSLFNRVRETGVEYVITKHGTPVAKVVPYDESRVEGGLFGSMKGTVLRFDRPFDPIDGEYDINRV